LDRAKEFDLSKILPQYEQYYEEVLEDYKLASVTKEKV